MIAKQPQMLQMSAVGTGQMSAVETGQMSAAETGQTLRQDDCLLLRRVSGSGAVWRLPQCSSLAPDGGGSLAPGDGGLPPPEKLFLRSLGRTAGGVEKTDHNRREDRRPYPTPGDP